MRLMFQVNNTCKPVTLTHSDVSFTIKLLKKEKKKGKKKQHTTPSPFIGQSEVGSNL